MDPHVWHVYRCVLGLWGAVIWLAAAAALAISLPELQSLLGGGLCSRQGALGVLCLCMVGTVDTTTIFLAFWFPLDLSPLRPRLSPSLPRNLDGSLYRSSPWSSASSRSELWWLQGDGQTGTEQVVWRWRIWWHFLAPAEEDLGSETGWVPGSLLADVHQSKGLRRRVVYHSFSHNRKATKMCILVQVNSPSSWCGGGFQRLLWLICVEDPRDFNVIYFSLWGALCCCVGTAVPSVVLLYVPAFEWFFVWSVCS